MTRADPCPAPGTAPGTAPGSASGPAPGPVRYAVPLLDLNAAWQSPGGAALIEAAVEDQEGGDAEVVSIGGVDAYVLPGPPPQVAALVSGLVASRMPGPAGRSVRVYAEGTRGWAAIADAPPVPELPEDSPWFPDEEDPE